MKKFKGKLRTDFVLWEVFCSALVNLVISPQLGTKNFGCLTSLAIDLGWEFCQLNVDIVVYVCTIKEKQCLHCTFRPYL